MENPDVTYMEMALELAEKGTGFTSPNPMVGAVIVKNNRVVGAGYHHAAGLPHAEVNAIADAGEDARGGTMYVTLEPCNHHGRTPPCTRAVIESGISKVVVAMADPNPVAGGGIPFLQENGIEVVMGVCEEKAIKLNAAFIKYSLTGLPLVILKCAATLDGKIATRTGDSKWITGVAARRHVHELRHAVDAIMVGVGTAKADNPRLTVRLDDFPAKDPIRVVLDTRLSIPEDAWIVQEEQASGTILVCGPHADRQAKKKLLNKKVSVLEAPVKDGLIEPSALLKLLGEKGITSILVEGGSRVSASLLRAGVVDRVCLFYAPRILGGDGIPMCAGPGPEKMASAINLENIEIRRFDGDILIEGDVVKEDTHS